MDKLNNIFIIEGPDKVGKTTIIKEFAKQHNLDIKKTPYIDRERILNDKSISNFTRQLIAFKSHYELSKLNDSFIQDRSFISSLVYYIQQNDMKLDMNFYKLFKKYQSLYENILLTNEKVKYNWIYLYRDEPFKDYETEKKDVFHKDNFDWNNFDKMYELIFYLFGIKVIKIKNQDKTVQDVINEIKRSI